MVHEAAADLFPDTHNSAQLQVINGRCLIRTQESLRVITVSGVVLSHYEIHDQMAEAFAMVSLVEQGWATQREVAAAFKHSSRTLRRYQRRFEKGGLAALGQNSGYPPGRRRVPHSREHWVHTLKSEGHSNCEIARRLGVTETAIRKLLKRMGWKSALPQGELDLSEDSRPKLPALQAKEVPTPAPTPASLDTNPADRRRDRLLAYLGLLEDATPMFASGLAVPRAGVLLALPGLVASGVFECAQQVYGSLGPSFYGLRTSLLTLCLMALWRIKRPEALKEQSPVDLGRVLGLDRAPEVKTLRRKLAQLAVSGKTAALAQALALRRVSQRPDMVGFLYVDGHVRAYHGEHRLPKTLVPRTHRAMPATTDYWVNDQAGDPVFVVTALANAGLSKMLPGVLQEVRTLVGCRRVTVVFDRGGYNFKLFTQILDAGFDLLTYRKFRFARIPQKNFRWYRTRMEGHWVSYRLADQEVRLNKGKLRLRQITRLSDDGHQTPILTSRRDLKAPVIAYRMFARWRQENFFKYLKEEYALDVLAEHAVQPDDPTREVLNPVWTAADAQLRQAKAHYVRLQAQYGLEAISHLQTKNSTMREFKTAQAKLSSQIAKVSNQIKALELRRNKLPKRVPVLTATQEPVVKLAPERKHLTNLIKMIAYNAESDLFRAVTPHYRRAGDEGRTLIQAAFASAGDIEVTEQELRIELAPLSSPHRTLAIAKLCQELNLTSTCFPGTTRRLHFSIKPPP